MKVTFYVSSLLVALALFVDRIHGQQQICKPNDRTKFVMVIL